MGRLATGAGGRPIRLLTVSTFFPGPERERLMALVAKLASQFQVRLLGARPHAALPSVYSATDALSRGRLTLFRQALEKHTIY